MKVLTAATHERYQSYMGGLPFDFYIWEYQNGKRWRSEFGAPPPNHILFKNYTPDLKPDLIISQSKFGQHQVLSKVARSVESPFIQVEHTLPDKNWSQEKIDKIARIGAATTIFLSDYSRRTWGVPKEYSTIITQCVDSTFWRPDPDCKKSRAILSVVNDYKEREGPCNFSGWEQTTRGLETTLCGTSNCGISKPANGPAHLKQIYNNHIIFLNTSRSSTMPFTLFEAMASGMCVVSTATTMIPEVIKHMQNGFLYDIDKPDDGRKLLQHLLTCSDEYLVEIGERARETVIQYFSVDKFCDNWEKVIRKYGNENFYDQN